MKGGLKTLLTSDDYKLILSVNGDSQDAESIIMGVNGRSDIYRITASLDTVLCLVSFHVKEI